MALAHHFRGLPTQHGSMAAGFRRARQGLGGREPVAGALPISADQGGGWDRDSHDLPRSTPSGPSSHSPVPPLPEALPPTSNCELRGLSFYLKLNLRFLFCTLASDFTFFLESA